MAEVSLALIIFPTGPIAVVWWGFATPIFSLEQCAKIACSSHYVVLQFENWGNISFWNVMTISFPNEYVHNTTIWNFCNLWIILSNFLFNCDNEAIYAAWLDMKYDLIITIEMRSHFTRHLLLLQHANVIWLSLLVRTLQKHIFLTLYGVLSVWLSEIMVSYPFYILLIIGYGTYNWTPPFKM